MVDLVHARRIVPVALAALTLTVAPATARAAWTSSISGNTVTMSEDATPFPLLIGVTGGNLSHNLAGQPGFASAQDFNSFNGAVVDTVPNSASVTLNIDGGTGDFDLINIGDASTPASAIAASVNANGGATSKDDQLGVSDFGATADRTVAVGPGSVTGLGGALSHSNFEGLNVNTGAGNDVVNVAAGLPFLGLVTGGGDDRIAPAEGAKVEVYGDAGIDTLDFSGWSSPVSTEPPVAGHFKINLNAAQEVTPSTSSATGTAFMSVVLATGVVEFLTVDINGITPAQEAGSHIQLGAPGVQDSILYDLETGPDPDVMWSANGGGMRLFDFSRSGVFPPSRIPDLVTGNTFINIRSTNPRCGPAGNQACADGEIRGQILPSDIIGFTAKAGTGNFNGIENLIGGSAADLLVGNALANTIDGGPGADIIRGAEGNDDVTGGGAADDLGGGVGDDRLRAGDGEPDTAIDCGPGTDVADRDLPSVDPDSILVECETVNTPAPPPGTITPIDARVTRAGKRLFTIETGAVAMCPALVSGDCGLSADATARVKKGGGRRPLAKRKITLGTLSTTVAPGASAPVEIALTRKGSRKLAAARRLKVKMGIDLAVPAGQTTVVERAQRLKAPRRRR